MSFQSADPERKALARALLEKLLPAARELAAKTTESGFVPESDVGKAAFPHYRMANCVGVNIYRGEKGGWFADLVFEALPPGIPEAIGTPVKFPHSSPEEAVEQAVHMMAMLIADEDRPRPEPETVKAAFPFDDIVVSVPSRILGEIREAMRAMPALPERKDAMERIEAFRAEVLGGERLTMERADALSPRDKTRLMSVVSLALIAGIVRIPEWEEEPPPPGPRR